jgi:hypothetical protein
VPTVPELNCYHRKSLRTAAAFGLYARFDCRRPRGKGLPLRRLVLTGHPHRPCSITGAITYLSNQLGSIVGPRKRVRTKDGHVDRLRWPALYSFGNHVALPFRRYHSGLRTKSLDRMKGRGSLIFDRLSWLRRPFSCDAVHGSSPMYAGQVSRRDGSFQFVRASAPTIPQALATMRRPYTTLARTHLARGTRDTASKTRIINRNVSLLNCKLRNWCTG